MPTVNRESYPLQWPEGWTRTRPQDHALARPRLLVSGAREQFRTGACADTVRLGQAMTKKENRTAFKRHAFNHMPDTHRTRAMQPPANSWWLKGAAPGARDTFMEAAHDRAKSRGWSSVVPFAVNAAWEFR